MNKKILEIDEDFFEEKFYGLVLYTQKFSASEYFALFSVNSNFWAASHFRDSVVIFRVGRANAVEEGLLSIISWDQAELLNIMVKLYSSVLNLEEFKNQKIHYF